MMTLTIFLAFAIAISDLIKLSLMRTKTNVFWGLIWIFAAYFLTLWLTNLSMSEALAYFNLRHICLLGFIEIIIFVSYLFYEGKGNGILRLYPGLMLIFPIAMLSFGISRFVTGIDFKLVGIIVAVLMAVIMVGGTFFLRRLNCNKKWLYISSLLTLIIYILIYGIL